jgi:DNA repair exonuclease SbcCD ATPase subunit
MESLVALALGGGVALVGPALWRHIRRPRPEDTAIAGLKSFVQTQQQQLEGRYALLDERLKTLQGDLRRQDEGAAKQLLEVNRYNAEKLKSVEEKLGAVARSVQSCTQDGKRGDLEVAHISEEIKALIENQDRIENRLASIGDQLQSTVDSFAEELAEFETTLKEGWSDLEGWREKDAVPKLAALAEMATAVPAIQQQVGLLSENWSEAREAFAQVGQRLATLEDSSSMMEAIIGRLPAPTPTTPLGLAPPGASDVAGMEAQLAGLLRRQGELQQNFLARQGNRAGAPRPPAA